MTAQETPPSDSDPPPKDQVQRFADLYPGGENYVGQAEIDPETGDKIRYWTRDSRNPEPGEDPVPLQVEDYRTHLAPGKVSLGVEPTLEDGTARFGVIDVDARELGDALAALERRVQDLDLPLVVLRSKRGGAHLTVFLEEPAPVDRLRDALIAWSKSLGIHHHCEYFPKPVGTHKWINLPYAGNHNLQYALWDGRTLDLEEFLALAESSRTALASLDHRAHAPADGYQDALTEALEAAQEETPEGDVVRDYPAPKDLWDEDKEIQERNKAAYGATLDLARDPKVGPHPALIEQLIRARLFHRFAVPADDDRHPFTDQELRQTIQSALRRLEREERQEEDDDPASLLVSAAELAQDPNLLEPPATVLPWIAWEARITLLAAREKHGKSWLAAHQAALGSRQGKSIVWLQEEFAGDVLRRFQDFGADLSNIDLLRRPFGSWEEFHTALEAADPDVVVVDTLATLVKNVADDVPETSQGEEWQAIFSTHFRRLADQGTGVVVVHHATKATGEYRGSTGIGAGADLILTMSKEEDEPNARHLDPVGRFHVPERRVLWTGSEYKEIPLEDDVGTSARRQVLDYVMDHPGASTNEIAQGVDLWRNAAVNARDALEAMGAIENQGQGTSHAWHATGKYDRALNPQSADAEVF